MTSDIFFKNNEDKFDIIFLDGLHTYEQTIKDINNAIQSIEDDGVILVHDCLCNSVLCMFINLGPRRAPIKILNVYCWKTSLVFPTQVFRQSKRRAPLILYKFMFNFHCYCSL